MTFIDILAILAFAAVAFFIISPDKAKAVWAKVKEKLGRK